MPRWHDIQKQFAPDRHFALVSVSVSASEPLVVTKFVTGAAVLLGLHSGLLSAFELLLGLLGEWGYLAPRRDSRTLSPREAVNYLDLVRRHSLIHWLGVEPGN